MCIFYDGMMDEIQKKVKKRLFQKPQLFGFFMIYNTIGVSKNQILKNRDFDKNFVDFEISKTRFFRDSI